MPAQVGERRRFGDHISEWDGNGWRPVEAPSDTVMGAGDSPTLPEMSPEEAYRAVMDPKFQAAMEQGKDVGAAEAAGPIMAMLGGAATTGLAGAAGAPGMIGRALTSPIGSGVVAGGEELIRTGDPMRAGKTAIVTAAGMKALGGIGGGVAKLLKPKPLTKALESQLKHTIVRGAKVAAEEVAEKAGGEVAQIGAAAARRAAEKAKTALLKEAHDYVTMSAKSSGMSRASIADALKIKMGDRVEMTASSARKLVDQILGPEPEKLVGNAAIRAAREKLGVK